MLLVALLLPWSGVRAEEEASAESFPARKARAAFLARGTGARAVGMGEAFVSVANDPSAVAWNPGGLGRITAFNALLMHNIIGQDMSENYVAAAVPVGPGVAGANLMMTSYGTLDLRDADGARIGTESPKDTTVMGAFAIPNPAWLGGRGYSGLTLEVVRDAVGGGGFAGGAGFLLPLAPQATLGAALRHLGPKSDGFSLPAVLQIGMSSLMSENILFAIDVERGLVDAITALAFGVEADLLGPLALRLGYKWIDNQGLGGFSGFTGGIGVRLAGFGLDYAFQPFGELAQCHRIALVYAGKMARPNVMWTGAEDEYRAARALYDRGDYAGAAARARAAVRADPGHWQAWQILGNCQYAKGDQAGAITSYQQSLQVNPDNPGLLVWVKQLEGR